MTENQDLILIATVGTGRNRADIADAIVFSIKRHAPARVVFLCSRKTKDETLPLVIEKLAWDTQRYQVDVCGDEEDIQRLFIEWNQRWPEWVAGREDAHAIVDFTSGTKAMSAAVVLLALARNAAALSYVTGQRDETGRVVRSEETKSFAPALIIAHRQLRLAVEHFHAGSYAAARDIAGEYLKIEALPNDDLREAARSAYFIAAAYEAWDRFDYRKAEEFLHQGKTLWTKWSWVDNAATLEDNRELIQQVRKSTKGVEFLWIALCADLLANVGRCFVRQAWDDAVARLYRACEMLAQLKLWRDYQIKTGDVDPAKIPDPAVRKKYQESKERLGERKLKLGLGESYELLAEIKDPLGLQYVHMGGGIAAKGDLFNLLQIRNDSLLAHGTHTIREDKAKALRQCMVDLARIVDEEGFRAWQAKARPVRFRAF